jgi:hypothetical protein
MGRIAFSQQNVDKDACVQHLVDANDALKVLQHVDAEKSLRYEPLDSTKLKLVAIADGALRKKSAKYSQGCFYILLTEVTEGHVGGRCHVLLFRSNRATRVSKSSMAAEVLVLVRASEALARIAAWMHEIWYGVHEARELIGVANPITTQLITDAHDVYSTLQCSRPYAGADESLSVYLESLREDLLQRRLDEFAWIPTTSMLADGGSKVMDDVLAQGLMRDRGWWPEEYKILFRIHMDGAASADREHERDEEDAESGQPLWVDSFDGKKQQQQEADAFAWFFGCTGFGSVSQGCGGTCPVCTGSHYEDPEDIIPDVYWLENADE